MIPHKHLYILFGDIILYVVYSERIVQEYCPASENVRGEKKRIGPVRSSVMLSLSHWKVGSLTSDKRVQFSVQF